ncbi:MAG: 1,4-alpha-glucan branching protein GlgB [Ruminococcus sp.]|nr:1,4-alpha-glucan branching protein GlgB [Ruminococcus sp.]
MDMYEFYTGKSFDAHEYLGAHIDNDSVVFRTFAPDVKGVGLLLDGAELAMNCIYDGNFYEIRVPQASAGQSYEYRIYFKSEGYHDRCDPYGFQSELRPNHKSVICDLSAYTFNDDKWMRSRSNCIDKPLNIYEMHLGSWRTDSDGEWLSYTEIAGQLVPYLKKTGYNYIEILPICEYPNDESWGYQTTGFFAPTSRYGNPTDLMKMIDILHQNKIGVILDFVPVHFAVDSFALEKYNGSALYEYPNTAVGVSEWGSYNFMHSRGEVRSFLQSAANYWMSYYHFDGLLMDAISRIIYWQGDESRGINGNALEFIKVMNSGLKERHKGCMLIAEDSTNYPKVTQPLENDGLGFDYKWDMGWMHDTLEYFQLPPCARSDNYHKLTFSMMYFHSENYLLPYSHDEVVHGKATILQKMNGQYEDKFPQARAMYLYMFVHSGKKLNFMGNEIGQLREWDEKREQDWDLRKYPIHDSFYRFMCDLNLIYLSHPALSEWDYKEEGFSWIDCHQENKCVYVISRKSSKEDLIAIFNFSDMPQTYKFTREYAGKKCELLLNSEWEQYGATVPYNNSFPPFSLDEGITLERFSGMLLKVL